MMAPNWTMFNIKLHHEVIDFENKKLQFTYSILSANVIILRMPLLSHLEFLLVLLPFTSIILCLKCIAFFYHTGIYLLL